VAPQRRGSYMENYLIECIQKSLEYIEKNIDKQMAKNISEKILKEVSNPIIYEGIEAKITVSIGITEYAIYIKDPYNIAYNALVSAKKDGRNNYKIS
jgi:GGDEF domain-containing protein